MNPNASAFALSFEISPIVLTDGIAGNIPGGMLPIVSLLESGSFDGLLSGGGDLSLDDFFAHFVPTTGGEIIKQRIGKYPFANAAVAANAVITDSKLVSLRMICPARAGSGGYAAKLATMTALQSAIAQHNSSGGTYTIATPSYFYTNCVMLGLRDVSSNGSAQSQTEWQWDFEQPLLTLQQAQQAQNNLMSKFSNGTQVPADSDGEVSWSGLGPTVGTPPSIAAPSVVGSAQNVGGAQNASPGRSTGTDIFSP